MNKNTNISLETSSFWCCGFALTLALAAGVRLEEALTWSFFWNGKISREVKNWNMTAWKQEAQTEKQPEGEILKEREGGKKT